MRFSNDVKALNPGIDAAIAAPAKAKKKKADDRADLLLDQLRTHAPDIAGRFTRDLPFQSFRIDLADAALGIAIEVNGGLQRPGGGKHATSRDHHKMRELALAGWLPLVFTSSEVWRDPLGCIAYIRRAIAVREAAPALFFAEVFRARNSEGAR